MAIPDVPSRRIRVGSPDGPPTELVDEVLASYLDWADDADAVTHAYRRWLHACAAERTVRFSAYFAALDQEQASAAAFALAIGELERVTGEILARRARGRACT